MATLLLPQSTSPTLEYDPNDPLNKGLVAWWSMKRSTGTGLLRDVVGGNDGTLEGSMTNDDWVVSPESKSLALRFDGNDDYIDLGTGTHWDDLFAGSYSFSCWFIQQGTVAQEVVLISKWWDGSTRQFGLLVEGNKLQWDHSNDAGNTTLELIGTTTITDDIWRFATITKNQASGEKVLYVNGLSEASTTQSQTSTNNAPLRIGNEYFNGTDMRWWEGSLADIRLYNRALSANEVHDLYTASRRGYPTQFKRRSFAVSIPEAAPAVDEGSTLIRTPFKRATDEYDPNDPLNRGLRRWYPMRTCDGLKARDLVDGDHALFTGIGGMTIDDWTVCPENKSLAVDFDGTDDYLHIGSDITTELGPKNAIACFAWVYNTDTSVDGAVVGNWASSGGSQFLLWHDVGGSAGYAAIVHTDTATNITAGQATASSTQDTWQHVGFTYQNGDIKVFVDGKLVDSASGSGGLANRTNNAAIGSENGDEKGRWWTGQISDVRIYDRGLNENEAHDLYTASRRGYPTQFKRRSFAVSIPEAAPAVDTGSTLARISVKSNVAPSYKAGYATKHDSAYPNLWEGLVGAWVPMMGPTGDTLKDVSGNRNHGTLGNMDPATDWVTSEKGWVLDFDGTDDQVLLDNLQDLAPNTAPNSVSYTALVKFAATGAYQPVISRRTGGSSGALTLDKASNDTLRFYYRHSGGWNIYQTTNAVTANVWYLIQAQHQFGTTSNLRIVVNGVVWSGSGGGSEDSNETAGDMFLGRNNTSEELNGQIAMAMVHNRLLKIRETQQLTADALAPFRRRRSIPLHIPEEVAAPDTGSTLARISVKSNVAPSYKSGYAKGASESAHPNLWDGLTLAYAPSMGPTGLTIKDLSGHANDGTLTHMVPSTDWRMSEKGWALNFDENDNHVRFTDGIPSWGTISLWFKADAHSTNGYMFSQYNDSAAGDRLYIFLADGVNNHTQARLDSSDASRVSPDGVEDDGLWHHVVLIYGTAAQVGQSKAYFDGIYEYTVNNATATLAIDPDNLTIGANRYNNGTTRQLEFDGLIGPVMAWDRALTRNEASQLYTDPLAPFRRRRSIPLHIPEEVAAPDTGSTLARISVKSSTQPSYKAGWAKSAGESMRPDHWQGLLAAWVPALGPTGATVPNWSPLNRDLPGTLTSIDASGGYVVDRTRWGPLQAITFDGSADYIDCNCSLDTLGHPNVSPWNLTVVAVAKNHGSPSTREGIVSSYTALATAGFSLRYENGGSPANGAVFASGNFSTNAAYFPAADFDLQEWNHYAGTKDTSTLQCFVNGIPGTSDTGSLTGTSQNIDIGADFARFSSRYWDGEIALVLIYVDKKSPGWVADHAADPFAMFRRRRRVPYAAVADAGGADYTLTADAGSFTLTGVAADPDAGRKIAAAVGTFTLTGIAADLDRNTKLTADVGAFTLTGIAAGLTWSGEAADYTLACDAGSFALTGIATGLAAGRKLGLDDGTFALTLIDADLDHNVKLSADVGAFTLTGTATGLSYSGAPSDYTLACDVGAFTLTGIAAAVAANRKLTLDDGTFTLTLIDAGLSSTRSMTAAVGAFTLTGIDAGLAVSRTLALSPGAFTLTGIAVDIDQNRTIALAAGSFTLTGIDTTLTYNAIVTPATFIYIESASIAVSESTGTIAVSTSTGTITV